MGFFDHHTGLRRAIAVLLAATLSSGCVRYQAVQGSYVTARSPDHVRVTLTDGRTEQVWYPAVSGNLLNGSRALGGSLVPLSIPLSQVRTIAVPRTAVVRTVLLVAGVSCAVLVVVAALSFQGMKGGYSDFGGF